MDANELIYWVMVVAAAPEVPSLQFAGEYLDRDPLGSEELHRVMVIKWLTDLIRRKGLWN
jgi:hypothetical protein